MKFEEQKSQFTVYVFSVDVNRGATVKVHLSNAGYDAYFFQDDETFLSRVQEYVPHVIVMDLSGLKKPLSDYFEQICRVSGEIKVLFWMEQEPFDVLSQYKPFGFESFVMRESFFLKEQTLFEVDRICEKLFTTYQNEQLYGKLQEQQELNTLREEVIVEDKAQLAHVVKLDVANRIANYKGFDSKEELIQRFFEQTSEIDWIYMRYVPQVTSFVVIAFQKFPAQQVEGLSYKIELRDLKDFLSQFSVGVTPPEMVQFLQAKVGVTITKALPLFVEGQLEGVFLTTSDLSSNFNEEYSLFMLSYSHLHLEKKVKVLEVFDPVTGLYNKNYYNRKLEEEVFRAKRGSIPMCVVKVSVDGLYNIESQLGEAVRDMLLKRVSEAIMKSSRANDVSCRVDTNEIALILPNCHRKGAAIRCERLRRMIESASLLDNGTAVTISQGISEYPTLAYNDKSLDESSTKALTYISEKGGNKLCIFKAPENYTPDFEVQTE